MGSDHPQKKKRATTQPHTCRNQRRAVPHSPVIDVRQPSLSRPIYNPTTINVQFRAAHGASIVMSTFRATYGWLGIDITARLLEHATRTANSLSAQNVDLPVGDHKITVSIADNHGRNRLAGVANVSGAMMRGNARFLNFFRASQRRGSSCDTQSGPEEEAQGTLEQPQPSLICADQGDRARARVV